MKAVLVPAEVGEGPRVVEFDGSISAMYELIDCRTVELIGLNRRDAIGWGDEEAKMVAEPAPNNLVTMIVYGPDPEVARAEQEQAKAEWEDAGFAVIDGSAPDPEGREPYIAGDVLITGQNKAGDCVEVPADIIEALVPPEDS